MPDGPNRDFLQAPDSATAFRRLWIGESIARFQLPDHATDLSKFISPTRTMVFMEANLATNDYTGIVGPQFDVRSIALRHGNRGHVILGDNHIEKLDKKKYDTVAKTKLFWFPSQDTTGPGGMDMGSGLSP